MRIHPAYFPFLVVVLLLLTHPLHAATDAECTDEPSWFDGSSVEGGTYTCTVDYVASRLMTDDRRARWESVQTCFSSYQGGVTMPLLDVINYTFVDYFFPDPSNLGNLTRKACFTQVLEAKRGLWEYCEDHVAQELNNMFACMPSGHGCVENDFSSICDAEDDLSLALRMCKLYRYTVERQYAQNAVPSEMNAIVTTAQPACAFPWWETPTITAFNLTMTDLVSDCSVVRQDNGLYARALLSYICYETLEVRQTGSVIVLVPQCDLPRHGSYLGDVYALRGVIDSATSSPSSGSNLTVMMEFTDQDLSNLFSVFLNAFADITNLWFTLGMDPYTGHVSVKHGQCELGYRIVSEGSSDTLPSFISALPNATWVSPPAPPSPPSSGVGNLMATFAHLCLIVTVSAVMIVAGGV